MSKLDYFPSLKAQWPADTVERRSVDLIHHSRP